jgi:hypothetical protein
MEDKMELKSKTPAEKAYENFMNKGMYDLAAELKGMDIWQLVKKYEERARVSAGDFIGRKPRSIDKKTIAEQIIEDAIRALKCAIFFETKNYYGDFNLSEKEDCKIYKVLCDTGL